MAEKEKDSEHNTMCFRMLIYLNFMKMYTERDGKVKRVSATAFHLLTHKEEYKEIARVQKPCEQQL